MSTRAIDDHAYAGLPSTADATHRRLYAGPDVKVQLTDPKTGTARSITVALRLDTPVELNYYRNGGILPTVLRKLTSS